MLYSEKIIKIRVNSIVSKILHGEFMNKLSFLLLTIILIFDSFQTISYIGKIRIYLVETSLQCWMKNLGIHLLFSGGLVCKSSFPASLIHQFFFIHHLPTFMWTISNCVAERSCWITNRTFVPDTLIQNQQSHQENQIFCDFFNIKSKNCAQCFR